MTRKVRREYRPEVVLGTHRDLMQAIVNMTEDELLAALKEEVARGADKRPDMIERLHRKYTRIRKERELQEYLS